MIMNNDLENIQKGALKEVESVSSEDDLENVFRKYIGRKGIVTAMLRDLKNMSEEDKREMGAMLNKVRGDIKEAIDLKKKSFEGGESKGEWMDVTRPLLEKEKIKKGAVHPITQIGWEIEDIFVSMGFDVVDGPQVETEYYNFEALNIPDNHPARDMWDTFWLRPKSEGNLLRTHTSPMQIRYMKEHKPPLRIIVPGRVFRYEATDSSHHFQFNQIEGLMVGSDVSVANFKSVMSSFFEKFFDDEIETRLRPGYFPFVEPGFEVDMKRKGKDWLEMAGAGMVHPNVLKEVGYNPDEVCGFAFCIGWDRLAMMKYKVDDVRLFQEGDIRFLKQFA